MLRPTSKRSFRVGIYRKRFVHSKDQPSLFDFGLDGSKRQAVPAAKRPIERVLNSSVVVLSPAQLGRVSVEEARPQILHPSTPPAFETANYDHYLRLKAETFSLAKTSGALSLLLVCDLIFGVKVSEAGLGPLKISYLRQSHLVGLIGWLTLLSAGTTLLRATYMLGKKIDCSLFYQRVLQFSGNPIIRFVSRFLSLLFVGVFVSIIAPTWMLARADMLAFVDFIVRSVPMLFDPWAATVIPAARC